MKSSSSIERIRRTFAGWMKLSLVAMLTVSLSGCIEGGLVGLGSTAEEAVATPSASLPLVDPKLPTAVKKFYTQKVSWKSCGVSPKTKCGNITVPLNWAKPSAGSIQLAVIYRKAEAKKPLGSIIFNPGGPGSSAYDWLVSNAESVGTQSLRAQYNIVAVDPRGVGMSEPKVRCLSAKDTDAFLYADQTEPLGSAADLAASRASARKFIDGCVASTGPALQFIDTVSAARDLDVVRAVFADTRLNYLGYSYGTFLGTIYASLFPKRVGRLVLDGAIDPKLSDYDQSLAQLKGFDSALKAYLANCLESSDCPFKSSGTAAKAEQRIADWFRGLEDRPLPTDSGRKLTVWAAQTGLIMALYSQDYWPYASDAFKDAFSGDGTGFMRLADLYNDRSPDGTYSSNIMEANISINCLDSRSPWVESEVAAQNQRVVAASKVFGRYWQNGALLCSMWPYPQVKMPTNLSATGSLPILVIGTTNDPATPYAQAQALAKLLKSGVLITYNGEGHTAYTRSNSCVDTAVDRFFLYGRVPKSDPQC